METRTRNRKRRGGDDDDDDDREDGFEVSWFPQFYTAGTMGNGGIALRMNAPSIDEEVDGAACATSLQTYRPHHTFNRIAPLHALPPNTNTIYTVRGLTKTPSLLHLDLVPPFTNETPAPTYSKATPAAVRAGRVRTPNNRAPAATGTAGTSRQRQQPMSGAAIPRT